MQLGPELHSYNASASQGTSPEKTYPAGIIVRLNATWYVNPVDTSTELVYNNMCGAGSP